MIFFILEFTKDAERIVVTEKLCTTKANGRKCKSAGPKIIPKIVCKDFIIKWKLVGKM